jgi:hypothetical protein
MFATDGLISPYVLPPMLESGNRTIRSSTRKLLSSASKRSFNNWESVSPVRMILLPSFLTEISKILSLRSGTCSSVNFRSRIFASLTGVHTVNNSPKITGSNKWLRFICQHSSCKTRWLNRDFRLPIPCYSYQNYEKNWGIFVEKGNL